MSVIQNTKRDQILFHVFGLIVSCPYRTDYFVELLFERCYSGYVEPLQKLRTRFWNLTTS